MSGKMTCPECGGWLVIEADGVRVSQDGLLHSPRAPRKINRRMIHMRWCTENRRTKKAPPTTPRESRDERV